MSVPTSWACAEGAWAVPYILQHEHLFLFKRTNGLERKFAMRLKQPSRQRRTSPSSWNTSLGTTKVIDYGPQIYSPPACSARLISCICPTQLTGTVHGFAVRPDFSLPEVKQAFEGALEQTVGWFAKKL